MRLLGSREVLELTDLTANQLREWTVRRALILPDVPAQKRGSEAKFSWQTVLVLRVAVVLRTRFHVELQAHRDLLVAARQLLDGASFPSLWNGTLVIHDFRRCELLLGRSGPGPDDDAVLLRLNRHLEVLSTGFGVLDPIAQLPLCPAVSLSGRESTDAVSHRVSGPQS